MPRLPKTTAPIPTRPLHVPRDIHRQVVILAAYREQGVAEVAVEALKVGLATLDRKPRSESVQPSSNN